MKYSIYLFAAVLFLSSCKEEPDPVACMTNVNAEYTIFDEASFENCSQNAATYFWSVEGTTTSLSHTDETVQYTWDTPGSYVVSLIVSSESGEKVDAITQGVEVVDYCFSCIYLATGPSSEEIVCATTEGSIDGANDRKQELNDLGYTCTEVE